MEEVPEQWKQFITLFFVRQIVKLSEFISSMNDKKYFVQDVAGGHHCEYEQ